jgi:hypothetical protein
MRAQTDMGPHSVSVTTRARGNTPPLGLPNSLVFSSVSGGSNTMPSSDTSRRRAQKASKVSLDATGTAIRSNNVFTGSNPNRCRAWVMPPEVGSVHEGSHDLHNRSDPTSFRSTPS